MTAIYIEIIATKGSAPRDAGTAMKVTPDALFGTIGGGALEHQAIAHARFMLATDAPETRQTIPLGPGLGQCCGGSVRLLFTRQARPVDADVFIAAYCLPATYPPRPLWVWGAGHVGRAVVQQAATTGAFNITWVDSARTRFPTDIPPSVTALPAAQMPHLMPHAPRDAHHLIMTYSHDIDLAVCAAALRHGFGFCGLIGSATKWARFGTRLRALGLDPTTITCPIGDPALGKHPQQIAAGTLRALLAYHPQKEPA